MHIRIYNVYIYIDIYGKFYMYIYIMFPIARLFKIKSLQIYIHKLKWIKGP